MNVLVTGGAGYIGSHAVKHLKSQGHNVVVVDNLYRGHRAAVPADVTFVQADLLDTKALTDAMQQNSIECVMHFAALAYVGESVDDPLKYYENNTAGSISLLKAMTAANVRKLVFSSTCATYGQPDVVPITESESQHPMSPYGMSKLMVEHVLRDYAASQDDFAYAALRYFNVAGSAADGSIGEDHTPETHLIPVILEVALGRRESISIFGEDYDTADGTCVRDYIHVEDLVAAHAVVMAALQPGDERYYNLGIGRGHSVKEVIEGARKVTGHAIPAKVAPRRAGDPAELFADSSKIQSELGWKPKYTEIESIISTAWQWFEKHPDGYGD